MNDLEVCWINKPFSDENNVLTFMLYVIHSYNSNDHLEETNTCVCVCVCVCV